MSDYLLDFSGENIEEGDAVMAAELAPFVINGRFSIDAHRAAEGSDGIYGDIEDLIAEYE